jgi:hypothetical protein
MMLATGMMMIGVGLGTVAVIFGLALFVMWFLTNVLDISISAKVKGEASSAVGKLWILTSGGGGFFFGLVLLALFSVWVVVHLLV